MCYNGILIMFKKNCLKGFFLILLCPILCAKPLNIYVDFAVFRHNEKQNVIEIYYGFLDSSLTYKKKGEVFFANLSMQIDFFANDSLFDQNEWIVFYQRDKKQISSGNEYLLVGQKNFLVPAGIPVKFTLKAVDSNEVSKSSLRTFEVENPVFDLKTLQISGVEFAQFIERTDTSNFIWQREFLKGNYYVIPNPTGEIVGNSPKLFTYFEYYVPESRLNRILTIEYRLFDMLNNEVYYNFRKVKAFAKAQVDINGFALDALPSGAYYFDLKIIDSVDKTLCLASKRKIYLVNPEMPPQPIRAFSESDLFTKSKFSILKEEELDREFDKAKYIANEYEKQLYKELQTTEAKRRFLFSFWRRRNPDTTLVFNQAYDDFNHKIDYANRFFSVGKAIEGWRTDRGRILIQYGQPTSREFHPREGTNRSYEIWFYAKQAGGIFFYFVDLTGNGNYVLVHSTASGEPYNETWYTDFVTGTNFERIQKLLLK